MSFREYSDDMVDILDMVASERGRQEKLKGEGRFAYTCADDQMTHAEAMTVLSEEVGEVAHEVNEGIGPNRSVDKRRLLKELIETAAVAVSWAEKVKREIETPEAIHTKFKEGDSVYLTARGHVGKITAVSKDHGGVYMHRYFGTYTRPGINGKPTEDTWGAYEDELELWQDRLQRLASKP